MGRRLFYETARRVSSPEAEVREELVKTVERTDIDFDRDGLQGIFSSRVTTVTYEWFLEQEEDETIVTQRLYADEWLSLSMFTAFPLTTLLCLTVFVVIGPERFLTVDIFQDTIRVGQAEQAVFAAEFILLCASIIPVGFFEMLPLPLNRFDDSQWEYTAGLVATIHLVSAILIIFIVLLMISIFFFASLVLSNIYILITIIFLGGFIPTIILLQLERQGRLETVQFDRTLLSQWQQSWSDSRIAASGVGSLLLFGRLFSSETDDLEIPYRTVRAEFGAGRFDAAVESVRKAANSVGINVDTDLLEVDDDSVVDGGEVKEYDVRGRYEWEISRQHMDDGTPKIVVEETLYVSTMILSSLQAAAFIGAAVLTLTALGDPLPPLPFNTSLAVVIFYILLSTVVFPLYACMLFYTAIRPDSLPIGLNLGDTGPRLREKQKRMKPFVVATMIFAIVGVAPEVFTFRFETVVSFGSIAGLLAVVGLAEVRYESVSQWFDGQSRSHIAPPFDFWLSVFTVMAIPPILLFVNGFSQVFPETAMATATALVALLLVALTLKESYSRFEEAVVTFEGQGHEPGPVRRWALYAIAIVTSVGIVAFVLYTARIQAATAKSVIEVIFYVGPLLLLVGFPLLGVVYQIGSKALTLYSLFEHSHRVDPETVGIGSETVEAELRLFDGPVGTSTGVTLRDGVVFLSRGDAELLDPPELAALLAHEDAHATRYADGRLSVLAPLIAAVTLTGQNLLLAALNFRSREFRADDYAADTTSPRQVRRALSEVHAERHSPNTEKARDAGRVDASGPHVVPGPAFGSFRPPESELSVLQRLFGTIYGGFTISRAHPSIEARIDRLRQREREEE